MHQGQQQAEGASGNFGQEPLLRFLSDGAPKAGCAGFGLGNVHTFSGLRDAGAIQICPLRWLEHRDGGLECESLKKKVVGAVDTAPGGLHGEGTLAGIFGHRLSLGGGLPPESARPQA